MSNPALRGNDLTYDFFTLPDVEFTKKKGEVNETSKNKRSIEEINNLTGILNCKFNGDMDCQIKFLNTYLNKKENLIGKLNANFTSLQEEMKKIGSIYCNISGILSDLKNLSEENCDSESEINSYLNYEVLYKSISKNYLKQNNILEVEFKDFFEFLKNEINTFKDKCLIYDEIKEDYFKHINNMKSKQEKLFNVKNFQKWELSPEDLEKTDSFVLNDKEKAFKIMCFNDRKVVEKKLNKLGVCCYSVLNEIEKFKYYYGKVFNDHFSSISERNKEYLSDVFEVMKTLNNGNDKIKRSSSFKKGLS